MSLRKDETAADRTIRYLRERTSEEPDDIGLLAGCLVCALIGVCMAAEIDPRQALEETLAAQRKMLG